MYAIKVYLKAKQTKSKTIKANSEKNSIMSSEARLRRSANKQNNKVVASEPKQWIKKSQLKVHRWEQTKYEHRKKEEKTKFCVFSRKHKHSF